PSFCLLAQDDKAVAVIVHGAAQLIISDDTGDEVLSGRKVSTWVDRVVEEPFAAMVASAAGETPPDVEDGFDLQAGTVPGSGFTVAARTAGSSRAPGAKAPRSAKKRSPAKASARPPRQVPKKAAGRSPAPPAEDETRLEDDMPAAVASAVATPPPPPPPPPPAGSFASVSLSDAVEEPRAPLAIAGEPGAPIDEVLGPETDGEMVQGVVCSRGHFNDPSTAYCAVCGISMVHRTFNLVSGRRPPLGVVVFEDGATYNLDDGYVVGREPEGDDAVRAGRIRPLTIEDTNRTLSRVHAEIRLEGWEVQIVDRGSANGTFVARPKETAWAKLPAGEPTTITPGTRVRLGDHVFLFDSHHQVSG
ncbi:MAG: FHA domain-containing protein, partial [Acidimicrobiales bacterium]